MLTSIRGILTATLLAGTALAATPALADETDPPSAITITGSATITSQYRFRGISQSNNKPAVQASISASHESGFYVSVWGSSVSGSPIDTPVYYAGTEIDVYGGWTKDLGGVKVDVGGYGYIYPGVSTSNFYEIYGSVAGTVGPVTAKAGVNYAPGQNFFKLLGTTNHNVYVYGDLGFAIPGTPITLNGHVGYTDGGLRYIKNYLDWSVGASASWKNLTLSASVVGTNISRSEADVFGPIGPCGGFGPCVDYNHRPAKTVGVVSLTASF